MLPKEKKPFGRGKGNAGSKNNSCYCTFCNRTNHTVEFFYQKHGYPNSFKPNSSANASSTDTTDGKIAHSAIDNASTTGLTQEHYNHFVSLLQQSQLLTSAPSSPPPQPTSNHIASTSSNPSSSILLSQSPSIHTIFSGALTHSSPHWQVDSGANEHICSSLHFLSSPYTIKPVCVNLPNGNTVTIHIADTVVFSPSFQITNVLYSPHFKVNLISVAKICISSHCFVKFLPNHDIIQDLNSNRMIGLADKCDGLYKLRVPLSVVSHCSIPPNNDSKSVNSSSVSFIPESALWHFRLGHVQSKIDQYA